MDQLRKYIRKVIKESIEEAYPESFNMETFKSLRNHAERNRYAAEHLPKIAAGSSRIVYKIDDEKVLKLAKNNKGIAQNETEIQWGNDSYFGSVLARTFDSDDNALWVEMELARKINNSTFKKLTGFDISDVNTYLRIFEAENNGRKAWWSMDPELKARMNEDEFITQILDFSQSADIEVGDFGRASSYGVVKRDGHEVLVITDYGLTKDVYQTHYEKPKQKRFASMYESVLELVKKTLSENIEPNLNDNFKNWFDGSKVVDASGNPIPVHHGTSKKFSKFNIKKGNQPIIWFTSNKSAIEAGEVGAAGKGHIMDLYASIKNPAGWDEYEKYGLGQLKGLGYDGVILPDADGTFTGFVFEPNQLKSVNNKGEWNPGDKNIYKEDIINEEALWQQRLDKAFDWIKKNNIEIGNDEINSYVNWNKDNVDNIEKYIYTLKEKEYLYSSDRPMFFVASMSDLKSGELDSGQQEIKIDRYKIKTLEYHYTHAWNKQSWTGAGIKDKYRLTLISESHGEFNEELTGQEIIDLYNGKVIETEHGEFATTPEAIEVYLRAEGIIK